MSTSEDVVFSLGAVPTPMHLAARKRWIEQSFQNAGVRMHNLLEHPKGDTLHFYHSHKQHFRTGGVFSALWARANGADTKVISMLWVPSRTDILVKTASSLLSPNQLRGCRLSLPVRDYLPVDYPRASAYYSYANILAQHDIGLDEVEFVSVPVRRRQHAQQEGIPLFMPHSTQRAVVPQQEEADQLASGRADAMLSHLGRGLLHLKHGSLRSIFTSIQAPGERKAQHATNAYPVLTVVNREFAEHRPDLVKLWLRLEFLIAFWAMENPDDNAAALAGMTDIPVFLLPDAYSQDYHKCLLPDMDTEGVESVRKIKEFSLDHKLLNRDFSEKDWFMPQFLQEVREEMNIESLV